MDVEAELNMLRFGKWMVCASAAALALPQGAFAQDGRHYPVKAIRMVIGFAPGGPADIAGRAVAPKLAELLGQQIVVDNRGGAGGVIGMDIVAKAPPDGHVIALGAAGNMIVGPQLNPNIPYDVQRDLAAVSQVATSPFVIAVNPSVPVRSTGELVRLIDSGKHQLTYGTSGNGSVSHITTELLRRVLQAELVHVPYKGTGPALTAVVSGEIDMMVADMAPARPLAESGRLRLLATIGTKRSSVMPQLPAVAEAGVKMPPIGGRYGILVPAGTPREVVAKLNQAVAAALKSPDVRQRFASIGFEAVGDTPEQFAAVLKTEGELIGDVIRKAGIRPD